MTLQNISDIEPEQLQSLLLSCETKPHLLRMIGHEALIDGNLSVFEVMQQVCFDKASNPATSNPKEYSEVYVFFDQLLDQEVVINQ